ncbi:MAG: hypothetical protein IPL15_10770 [Comamonadaceae bacterium]|uniref:hypothetical protein n=1 Tax=Candidatus Skiveiella danica TaxID=3386177 RepID=UPI00390AFC31|nr:hypothetical protein [Comamonadaceae bacterium]
MGKGSRNAALLAESRDRIKAQEELAMATIAGNMAVDMQGERSSKPSKKEKDKKDKLAAEPSKLKIGLSDLGGMAAAQGLNEGWSYLMRVAGRASVDGFVAENNDYLQASFPAIGGLLWYLIELYGVGKAPPGSFKMGRMEAAKVLGNLGMSKFFQAIRSRGAATKRELELAQADAQKAIADNKVMAENLEKLKVALKESAEREAQLKRGGNGNGGTR